MKLVVVDASSLIYRAVYVPNSMSSGDGENTGGVFIFVKTLFALLKELAPTHLAFALDGRKEQGVRRAIFPAYKSDRKGRLSEEEFAQAQMQYGRCIELIDLFGVESFLAPRWEADDVAASLAERFKAEVEVTLVSGDKDFGQLVDERVTLYDPFKKVLLDRAAIEERWGVPVEWVPMVQAMMGDSTDNIPGVPGVGPKTAGQLVAHCSGDLAMLQRGVGASMKKAQAIQQTDLSLMLRLVTLNRTLKFPVELDELRFRELDVRRASPVLRALGFRSLFDDTPSLQLT